MKSLCALFFFVAFFSLPKYGALHPEYGVVFCGLFFGIIAARYKIISHFKSELSLLAVMFLASILSVMVQISSGHIFIWRDAMILMHIGYYACVIIFVAMACNHLKKYEGAKLVLLCIAILVSGISIAQYFDILNINQIILPTLDGRSELLNEGVSWRRVIGTIGNPNYWGLLISAVLAIIAYNIFWQGRLFYLPLFFLLFASLILTGSRTAIICLVAGIIFGAIIVRHTAEENPRIIFIIAALFISFALIVWTQLDTFYENKERFSVNNIDTLLYRIFLWQDLWESGSKNILTFLIGQGPRKGVNVIHFADNSYVKIWHDYGLVGLSLYIGLLSLMIRKTIRLIRNSDDEEKLWSRGLLFVLIGWMVFELAADAWFMVRLGAPMLGFYVFVHTVAYRRAQSISVENAPAITWTYHDRLISPRIDFTTLKFKGIRNNDMPNIEG